MPLVLPFELVDTILHQVQTDKPTLLSCALVSRSWLTRCRILLFSTLRINGGNPEQSFGRFANFIASSPHIRIKVQQLELYGDFPLKPPVLVQDTMTTILNNLPRLQTLSLSQVVFQPFHQAMTTKPSHRLQKLIITGCPVESRGDAASGHDFSGYWAVIALFAQIKHLHIGDLLTFLTGEDHLGPPTLSFQVDSEIEAFTIGYNAHTASMISSFRSFASQRTLKTIEVSCFCPSDLREFGELLREAAVYVRHAGICVSDGAPLFHTEGNREAILCLLGRN